MARSRSLPSNLFDDPDFFECSSDIQVILVGLVLTADDFGRGLAHVGLLSRKLNKAPALIEEALSYLETCGLLECYQVERRSYYSLTKWQDWETLSKPTPSKYPAPPASQDFPEKPRGNLGNSGQPIKTPLEVEDEGEGEEEKEQEDEGEEEHSPCSNVVPFPTHADNAAVSHEQIQKTTRHVACILKLTPTDALMRVVEDYLPQTTLFLLGEADAAREWIDDPGRNKKHKRMTPTFYRHWLQRECDARQRQEATLAAALSQQQAKGTGTAGPAQEGTTPRPSSLGLAGRNLMDLEKQYREAVQRKQPTSTQTAGEGRS